MFLSQNNVAQTLHLNFQASMKGDQGSQQFHAGRNVAKLQHPANTICNLVIKMENVTKWETKY